MRECEQECFLSLGPVPCERIREVRRGRSVPCFLCSIEKEGVTAGEGQGLLGQADWSAEDLGRHAA